MNEKTNKRITGIGQIKDSELILVQNIFGTFKKISLYKFKHPVVQKSIQESWKQIRQVLLKKKELTISRTDKEIITEGCIIEKNNHYYTEIFAVFDRLSIESITLYTDLSLNEFELLLKIFMAKQEVLDNKGGILNILIKAGSRHIKINKTKYEKVSDLQKETNKDNLYEISDHINDDEPYYETIDNKTNKDFKTLLKDEINKLTNSFDESEKIYELLLNRFFAEMEERITEETKTLKTKNKKITFEKKRTESVIKSIADGLVVVDNNGKVLMMNPSAKGLFGEKNKDMTGKHIMEGIGEEQMISLSNEKYRGNDSKIKEIEIGGPKETQKTIRTSTAVIEDESGKTIGMVSILTDITRQRELEKMKSDFMVNVTHELRTPLASIKQTIALILEGITGSINQNQEKFLLMAKKSIDRLTRLINDLLDFSKLEDGKMELRLIKTDIERVITEAIESLTNWADSKKITLIKDIKTLIPEFLFDPDRITQILTNLISNAVKFSNSGGVVTISTNLTLKKHGAVADILEISVKDNGIGLSLKEQGLVFEKFKQVGGKHPTDIKGTGLGLPITKDFVEMHKGRIWVESEKGKGSKFIFALPIAVNSL